MSKCLNDNGPGGPVEETVMTFLNKWIVIGYVPLNSRSCFKIEPVLGFHAKVAPTILVEIPMQRPSDAGKSNVSLKEIR